MAKCNRKQRLLGKSIRRIRMRRNMTQRELANAAGLGESAFRSYELGERSPKQNTLERIAKALDVAAVGVPRAAIYAALKKHIATKGLHFYFADEPKPDEEFFRNRNWTRVRCKETGVVYESIAQAARETGVSERDIQAAAKRHGTTKGLHFYYADEPEPNDLLPSKKGIRVRCVETGVVYKTITQAAKETGASQAGIRGAASGMAGGYHWEYVDD